MVVKDKFVLSIRRILLNWLESIKISAAMLVRQFSKFCTICPEYSRIIGCFWRQRHSRLISCRNYPSEMLSSEGVGTKWTKTCAPQKGNICIQANLNQLTIQKWKWIMWQEIEAWCKQGAITKVKGITASEPWKYTPACGLLVDWKAHTAVAVINSSKICQTHRE